MSSFSENTQAQRSTVIDYERQFQEDLERAQALSLESLALEKFRLQKQQTPGTEDKAKQTYVKNESQNSNSILQSETDGPVTTDKYAIFRK